MAWPDGNERWSLLYELLGGVGDGDTGGVGGHGGQRQLGPGCGVVDVEGFQREHRGHGHVLQHVVEGIAAVLRRGGEMKNEK